MAKRKAAGATRRKKASNRAKSARAKLSARKRAKTTGRRRKTSAKPARKAGSARRPARRSKKTPARKTASRKARVQKVSAQTRRGRKTSARAAGPRKPLARTAAVPKMAPQKPTVRAAAVARKVPALDRERRVIRDDDLVPTPPSSLDLDRSASAARSGRRELSERIHHHTETSPAITGGDVDADWESAYSVGDEAPGGDNPTPDQDIVDDIGRAIGVQYEDNEELKGEKKISDRDRKRWELDPASSEDYDDR